MILGLRRILLARIALEIVRLDLQLNCNGLYDIESMTMVVYEHTVYTLYSHLETLAD